MNTFLRVAIAMVGMTGLAAAQPKADSKPADPKLAAKAADPKPADPKPAGGMAEMKPPPEIAAMAKGATGTWRCKGQAAVDETMKMVDMTGTMKMKLEMSWWMHATFESKMGKTPFQFESYTTFDPSSKKWKRIMVENSGGWSTGESAGMKDNKLDWEIATHSPTMGDGVFRDHEDLSDAKAGVKMWGEFSPDKGKTWVKVYEMSCKK